MKKISINNTDYNIKTTFRAMMEVERMTGKAFQLKGTTTDLLTYSYAILKVNNTDFDMTFDAFIDAVDTDPSIFVRMTQFITDEWSGAGEDKGGQNQSKKK